MIITSRFLPTILTAGTHRPLYPTIRVNDTPPDHLENARRMVSRWFPSKGAEEQEKLRGENFDWIRGLVNGDDSIRPEEVTADLLGRFQPVSKAQVIGGCQASPPQRSSEEIGKLIEGVADSGLVRLAQDGIYPRTLLHFLENSRHRAEHPTYRVLKNLWKVTPLIGANMA